MGLTIHYGLKLNRNTSETNARMKLEALRQCCLDLPFKEVSPQIVSFRGAKCDYNLYRDDKHPLHAWSWLLIQARENLVYHYDRDGVPQPGSTKKGCGTIHRDVLPELVIGFSAWPGDGCEEANVGLCLFPATVEVEHEWDRSKTKTFKTNLGGWHWHSFCKTQYANSPEAGGLENFLRCHMTVIAMLDKAASLGFKVHVSDESDYWQKRDISALIREIGEWDSFIAAFGAGLKSIVGDGLVSAMDNRADAKELAAKGQPLLPKEFNETVQKIAAITAAITPKPETYAKTS